MVLLLREYSIVTSIRALFAFYFIQIFMTKQKTTIYSLLIEKSTTIMTSKGLSHFFFLNWNQITSMVNKYQHSIHTTIEKCHFKKKINKNILIIYYFHCLNGIFFKNSFICQQYAAKWKIPIQFLIINIVWRSNQPYRIKVSLVCLYLLLLLFVLSFQMKNKRETETKI